MLNQKYILSFCASPDVLYCSCTNRKDFSKPFIILCYGHESIQRLAQNQNCFLSAINFMHAQWLITSHSFALIFDSLDFDC